MSMKKFKVAAVAAGAMLVTASNSFAEFEVPALSVADLGPVEAWLGIAVVSYLALFGYRKFTKTANRT